MTRGEIATRDAGATGVTRIVPRCWKPAGVAGWIIREGLHEGSKRRRVAEGRPEHISLEIPASGKDQTLKNRRSEEDHENATIVRVTDLLWKRKVHWRRQPQKAHDPGHITGHRVARCRIQHLHPGRRQAILAEREEQPVAAREERKEHGFARGGAGQRAQAIGAGLCRALEHVAQPQARRCGQ